MTMHPLVSIIIPVYNGSNYLREAIDSALAQTYQNFEILVINDGSNDGGKTEEIALAYGDKIRYVTKVNGGVASALNLGIHEMRGEYFSWLSHDDWYYPHKLQRQIEALQKCGDPTRIVYSWRDFFNQKKNNLILSSPYVNTLQRKMEFSVFPLLEGKINASTLLIHRNHFKRIGFFNERLLTTQDYDFMFRLLLDQKLIFITESLMVTRLHQKQTSNTKDHIQEDKSLYMSFVKNLTDEQISSIYSSRYHFYGCMMESKIPTLLPYIYRYFVKLFMNEPVPNDINKKIINFHTTIAGFLKKDGINLSIFGAGNWGRRLYHELTNRLIKVDGFCDNDPKKIGHVVDNLFCIPFGQLEAKKNDTLVIVANANPDDIVNQLKEAGFPYVATRQQLLEMLFATPALKWMCALDGLDGVDYSLPQNQVLIGELKSTIRDICMHYLKESNI